MKKTKIKKDLFNRIKEIGSENKVRGITLISLVVTIIILIIISSISLGIILGNNGLINRAKTAKEEYQNSIDDENRKLQEIYSKILLADSNSTTLENIDMTTLKKLIREEGNPVGTIIAFYGETAPKGYLPCDGTSRNISDYSELAIFLGATGETFNLPDLRGEFLRGTGTNGHTNQGNGATVGTHQDGTTSLYMGVDQDNHNLWVETTGTIDGHSIFPQNADKVTSSNDKTGQWWARGGTYSSVNGNMIYTSRPTNTSVLYCIKY